ncbi:bifunctional alpha,alpha-trehalose-phosphate synthase (UDP-forming)/trehalose-phosphatase [Aquimarina sp. AD10]|uniref:bifunctional alpha,alpha-trehalose-phosphate synthase (UDP-forming)/trehalose-phosphatase n=1 Tax=Aquimarina sp. AD10 TaxID=1714849 RepID=UPI000E478640|nr:bifunctional alpha,alpha-trehalose-phosphate synthase (UDP-forming)/trehalose-phosphatase [Aquimarina sp. AD10]AXT59493.1 bifunctional alpha,alpha-trehalose-phosphate synthase (UDP-forming)/trehalose-phosphatase [Aquimarina sp. AD10]RKN00394.1 bifunctional alpha,alpha-trehalose-phosphate synthase (UDP-forming)/trehalose-phosphatase [Aquimarina sp. AD10]
MNKTIIVSNRLPLQVSIKNNSLKIIPSVGGLATGMKSVHAEGNGIWIGWSGIPEEELDSALSKEVAQEIQKEKCVSVPLSVKDIEEYYEGFSNKALWPLFHYFMEYTEFKEQEWEAYKRVNQKFAEVILENIEDGDTVWVHDYQLLLLPQLIKDKKPNTTIGFFLHIPFPSYEIFRTFPWRKEILTGMIGADLLGFHTYDYERHFLSSVKRILRLEVNFNQISYQDRLIMVDSFPMGIDYDKFYNAALEHSSTPQENREFYQRLQEHTSEDKKLILSIDRMDYTKGIPNRIKAFEYFLDKFPEYKEKARLVMLAVPSRSNVPQYKKLKRETDELVGRINGKFATVSWTPIWYFYRALSFDDLIDLYISSDVALITPIRDGMNLVAKEYVATRTKSDGVLILSEMAGASKEMNEALLINPNSFEDFADNLKGALCMPLDEQQKRMKFLQKRLKRYNVEKWAKEFLASLETTKQLKGAIIAKKLTGDYEKKLLSDYHQKKKKLLLLDYDGTLVGFKDDPQDAKPDANLYNLLDKIQEQENTTVVLISGRDKETFKKWFGHKNYDLVTDHGVWIYQNNEWIMLERIKTDWMESIRPILETFVDRTPGTFIETKNYSLAWHYRMADPELVKIRTIELNTVLTSMVENNDLMVLKGNKVIEIKSSNVNKGRAMSRLIIQEDYDFMTVIGDDWTDEYMFEEAPEWAYTIKVGFAKTKAMYQVKDPEQVTELLTKML